jgi:mono/diheme cytochrome c family protein
MAKRTKIALLSIAVLAFGGLLALMWILNYGFSARDEPTAIEAYVARSLRHLAVPGSDRGRQNPVPLDDDVLSGARAHFADHCALCHGNDGKGEMKIGKNLYPKAPDMTLPATQSLSDGELFYIIKNGVRLTGMPAWGEDTEEDDRESWKLVHLIRHFPEITETELEKMGEMNPMSRDEFEEEEAIRRFLEGEGDPPVPSKHAH